MNRAERRRRARRSAGRAVHLAGAGVLIGAGLTGGYLGTYRSRADAAIIGFSCAGLEGGGVIDDDTTLRGAIANVNAGNCNIVDISANITVLSNLPPIDAANVMGNALMITGTGPGVGVSGNLKSGFDIAGSPGGEFALEVTSLTLSGFYADDTGAAIQVNIDDTALVSLDDVEVRNNHSATRGAVDVRSTVYARANVTGTSRLYSNVSFAGAGAAIRVRGSGSAFGGIFVGGGADDSITIDANYAFGIGGALWASDTIAAADCVIADNSSGDLAGALYAGSSVSVEDCAVTRNHSASKGGAIATDGVVSSINSDFTFNSADDSGGAIFAFDDVTLVGGTFADDSTLGTGGALWTAGAVSVTDTSFQANSAVGGSGGAIYARSDVETTDADFLGNIASGAGGAIHTGVQDVTATGGSFVANASMASYGGAISGGRVEVSNAEFYGNYAGGAYGGAIYGNGDVYVYDSDFVANESRSHGGAIGLDADLRIERSTLIGNDARGGNGGALRVNGQIVAVDDTFVSNTADDNGGAIWASQSVTLTRGYFSSNRASGGDGGSIFVRSPVSLDDSIAIVGSHFEDGYAQGEGGAVSVDDTVSVIATTFIDNESRSAPGNGGGGALRSGGRTYVSSSRFVDNVAYSRGGAIYSDSDVEVDGSTFSANVARGDEGGAVHADASISMQGSSLTNNYAVEEGGALWSSDLVSSSYSTFRDNYTGPGGRGGAIRSREFTGGYLSFIDNGDSNFGMITTSHGGALFALDAISIDNSTFYANTADDNGGAIYDDSTSLADVSLTFVTAKGNFATNAGSFLSASSSADVGFVGSAIGNYPAGIDICFDNSLAGSIDAAPLSVYTYVTDISCGDQSGDITVTTSTYLALNSALTSDDTPGYQVLVPDDTSVLVNAIPYAPLRPARDQWLVSRNTPSGLTSVGAVQVLPAISIFYQPESVNALVDDTVAFVVGANGGTGPISYQWQSSTDGGTTWSNIAGNPSAQTDWLTIGGVTLAQSGLLFRVVMTDTNLTQAVSNAATLTVQAPVPPTPSPARPPSAPRDPLAVAGDRSVAVSWVAPVSSGSFPITRYEVVSDVGGHTCLSVVAAGEALSCELTGLRNGEAYRFRVRALNGAGWGAWSVWSESVTPERGRSIVITGSRDGRVVLVSGVTTGLVGERVRAMVRLGGQGSFSRGSSRLVDDQGRFGWKRTTVKKVRVYFTAGEVRSNRITIR